MTKQYRPTVGAFERRKRRADHVERVQKYLTAMRVPFWPGPNKGILHLERKGIAILFHPGTEFWFDEHGTRRFGTREMLRYLGYNAGPIPLPALKAPWSNEVIKTYGHKDLDSTALDTLKELTKDMDVEYYVCHPRRPLDARPCQLPDSLIVQAILKDKTTITVRQNAKGEKAYKV